MKISGITLDQFLENTKSAFSAANISDVKRDAIARKFLNFQLFPQQAPGENEHRLHELFEASASNIPSDATAAADENAIIYLPDNRVQVNGEIMSYDDFVRQTSSRLSGLSNGALEKTLSTLLWPQQESDNRVNVVMLKSYDFGENGGLVLEDVTPYICSTPEKTNDTLKDLFRQHYPDHIDGNYLADTASLVEKIIESEADGDEVVEREMMSELRKMDGAQVIEWLIDNISIDELVDDSFFGEFLNQGLFSIEIDSAEIR